jgi:hypothetical protein
MLDNYDRIWRLLLAKERKRHQRHILGVGYVKTSKKETSTVRRKKKDTQLQENEEV